MLAHRVLEHFKTLVAFPPQGDEIKEEVSANQKHGKMTEVPKEKVEDETYWKTFLKAPFPGENEASEEGRYSKRNEKDSTDDVDHTKQNNHPPIVF